MRLVRVPALYDGVEYAYAAVTPPAALVFTAGACPLDGRGATVGVGDVRAQARQCMANLETALAAAGAGLHDVLKTTVYVAADARTDLVAAWEEVRTAFGVHDSPGTQHDKTALGYADQQNKEKTEAQEPRTEKRSR